MSTVYDKEYFESGTKSNYQNYSHEVCYKDQEKLAKALIEIVRPSKILDIGYAKGFLVEGFQNFGVDAYGVDISEYAISCSHPNIKEKVFVLDAEKEELPFKNDYFDLVVMTEVIEHINNFDLIIKEIKRVLKKEGFIYLTAPTKKLFQKEKDITHINVQSRKFWIKTFGFYGFIPDKKMFDNFLEKRSGYYSNKLIKLGWIGNFILKKMTFLRSSISIRLFFKNKDR
ncbi:MAG: class I SAM-dependent methyltransferase [Candidatus Methanoperedenaceae archaeon]|nr:class I SAM-dependent methyltransferase [Candidatus Methanoperedenaceae archaeon]